MLALESHNLKDKYEPKFGEVAPTTVLKTFPDSLKLLSQAGENVSHRLHDNENIEKTFDTSPNSFVKPNSTCMTYNQNLKLYFQVHLKLYQSSLLYIFVLCVKPGKAVRKQLSCCGNKGIYSMSTVCVRWQRVRSDTCHHWDRNSLT